MIRDWGWAVLGACLMTASAGGWAQTSFAEAERARLDQLQALLERVNSRVQQLEAALETAERRNRDQSRLILRLESQLAAQEERDPGAQRHQRERFFALLADRLGTSPVCEVRPDRLIIPADAVFLASPGRLGAEGEERLAPIAAALSEVLSDLPTDRPWRLRVEGHTDRRLLRDRADFPSNWELSAARAVGVARFLIRHGIPEHHLEAVALAATQPLSRERNAAAYQRNRRVVIRLIFPFP